MNWRKGLMMMSSPDSLPVLLIYLRGDITWSLSLWCSGTFGKVVRRHSGVSGRLRLISGEKFGGGGGRRPSSVQVGTDSLTAPTTSVGRFMWSADIEGEMVATYLLVATLPGEVEEAGGGDELVVGVGVTVHGAGAGFRQSTQRFGPGLRRLSSVVGVSVCTRRLRPRAAAASWLQLPLHHVGGLILPKKRAR